jgi:hypothetical protein
MWLRLIASTQVMVGHGRGPQAKRGSMPASGGTQRVAMSVQNSCQSQPTRSGKMTYWEPTYTPRLLRNQGIIYSP